MIDVLNVTAVKVHASYDKQTIISSGNTAMHVCLLIAETCKLSQAVSPYAETYANVPMHRDVMLHEIRSNELNMRRFMVVKYCRIFNNFIRT